MHPIQKTARMAAVWYLLLAVTGMFSLMYVPGKLIVHGDTAATATRVLAQETLFLSGITVGLASAVIFVYLVMALYRLLSGVNPHQAKLMAALVLVSVAIGFINELNSLAALLLFRGTGFLAVLDTAMRQTLAMLFLNLHGQGIMLNGFFWGLWLFPFGMLVYQSGFLPRILGIILIINGIAYITGSLISMYLPDRAATANQWLIIPETGELWFMLWLLIKGVKLPAPEPAVS